jgi:hypothetical protein
LKGRPRTVCGVLTSAGLLWDSSEWTRRRHFFGRRGRSICIARRPGAKCEPKKRLNADRDSQDSGTSLHRNCSSGYSLLCSVLCNAIVPNPRTLQRTRSWMTWCLVVHVFLKVGLELGISAVNRSMCGHITMIIC